MFPCLLLLVAGLLLISLPCEAVDFFVRPTQPPNQTCPEPCHTLDQYARNVSLFEGQTNISLFFLKGEHVLRYNFSVTGPGINKIVISGLDSSGTINDITAMVVLQSDVGICVSNVLNFELHNIAIKGKTTYVPIPDMSDPKRRPFLAPRGQPFRFVNVPNITQCHVEMTYINVSVHSDKLTVQNTTIAGCNYNRSRLSFTSDNANQAIIKLQNLTITGDSVYIYQDVHDFSELLTGVSYSSLVPTVLSLNIQEIKVYGWNYGIRIQCNPLTNCTLTNSRLTLYKTELTQNYFGLLISNLERRSRNHTRMNITIQSTKFLRCQVGLYLINVSTNSLTILDSQFSGLIIGMEMDRSEVYTSTVQNTQYSTNHNGIIVFKSSLHNMVVSNSSFSNNDVGWLIDDINECVTNITIVGTTISHNINFIIVAQSQTAIQTTDVILLQNCTITSNNATALELINFQGKTIVKDCSFQDNKDTPIATQLSRLELSGVTSFVNNRGVKGGALSLIHSTVSFTAHSNITFLNNYAEEHGGAIYVLSLDTEIDPNAALKSAYIPPSVLHIFSPCFFQHASSAQVTFKNNKAMLGGEHIYGASPYAENCSFTVFNVNKTVSSFASDPTRVCLCDNTPNCTDVQSIVKHQTRFPGELFHISLVVVGYDFETVTGTVFANILGGTYSTKLDVHTYPVDFDKCNVLNFMVNSDQSTEIIVLTTQETFTQDSSAADINDVFCYTIDNKCPAILTTPIYINVTLKNCPLGFKLNKNQACGCDDNLLQQLKTTNVTCEIRNHTGYINRQGTVWVGVDKSENDIYLKNKNCPHNYCNTNSTPVDLTNPDVQCSSNRVGVLCGKCAPGYSLQLGGNQCLKCPNNNTLALLIFFAAAGFLLVFFIKVLDLTVANGTINGLIFYSNVVWRYNDILFSLNDRQNIGYWVLTVPIAWINLDFGIESCFYDGLDQIGKSLLQFVFPIYIWSIAGLIIFVCHYSTRATKLFGNNSVSVLATLFLLSYGKLLRNITDVFTFADLIGSNNNTHRVWSLDGNVRYGESYHIAAISVAILFLILFVLPFTFAILFVPCLKSRSNLKPLHWINTLKPFFDTYYGPFKHKVHYQCWTGALLIVREVLLAIYAVTSTSNPNANILSLGITAVLLLMYSSMVGLLYKNWFLSLLENLYLINLVILGCTFLFYQPIRSEVDHVEINPVTAMSISIALFQFACLVILHLVRLCVPKRFWSTTKEKTNTRDEYQRLLPDKDPDVHFREPLIADTY